MTDSISVTLSCGRLQYTAWWSSVAKNIADVTAHRTPCPACRPRPAAARASPRGTLPRAPPPSDPRVRWERATPSRQSPAGRAAPSAARAAAPPARAAAARPCPVEFNINQVGNTCARERAGSASIHSNMLVSNPQPSTSAAPQSPQRQTQPAASGKHCPLPGPPRFTFFETEGISASPKHRPWIIFRSMRWIC